MTDKEPKIDVATAASLISKWVNKILPAIGKLSAEIQSRLANLNEYAQKLYESISQIRSFFDEESVDLYRYYVNLNIGNNKVEIDQVTANRLFASSPFSVIKGSGGCGKSTLLRHLIIGTLLEDDRIPILIELRNYNDSNLSVYEMCKQSVSSYGLVLTVQHIKRMLSSGMIALFIDGFDEVSIDKKKSIGEQIQNVTTTHDKATVVIMTRPDVYIDTWKTYSVYEVRGLTLEQAVKVASLAPFDESKRTRFAEELRAGLYEKHASFAENPLLLLILLLTFSDSAQIPSKRSEFYRQAFEVLFYRHDAKKGAGYIRKKQSGLDCMDFSKAFSAFCASTLFKGRITMSVSDAIKEAKIALRISGIDCDPGLLIDDAQQAVCLLYQDGGNVHFAHRSFQEYFAALFIAESELDRRKELLSFFLQSHDSNDVISILYDIKSAIVEIDLWLPLLDMFCEYIGLTSGTRISKHSILKFIRIWDEIRCEKSPSEYSHRLSYAITRQKPSIDLGNTLGADRVKMQSYIHIILWAIRTHLDRTVSKLTDEAKKEIDNERKIEKELILKSAATAVLKTSELTVDENVFAIYYNSQHRIISKHGAKAAWEFRSLLRKKTNEPSSLDKLFN